MGTSALKLLQTFDIDSIPDLDVVVMGALDLLKDIELPNNFPEFKKPIVIGSVNAFITGQIIFCDTNAVFADESSFEHILEKVEGIDGAVLVSASGSKHAVEIAKVLKEKGLQTVLFTNNPDALAKKHIDVANVLVFPKNREPYTYNTSTYMSMIFARTGEDAGGVQDFIVKEVESKLLRNFDSYGAFTLIVPPQFAQVIPMLRTKFDELFGPYVTGRVFTSEEIKHAKTVVTSGDELFIGFGVENEYYGIPKNRLSIPLPDNAGYGAVLAVSYYVVGKIQKVHPPYFKNGIEEYTKVASEIFNQTINPIVE